MLLALPWTVVAQPLAETFKSVFNTIILAVMTRPMGKILLEIRKAVSAKYPITGIINIQIKNKSKQGSQCTVEKEALKTVLSF